MLMPAPFNQKIKCQSPTNKHNITNNPHTLNANSNNITTIHINLFDILKSNQQLKYFFQARAQTKQQFQNLTKQLLLHAIKTKNQIPKRYHISYIKHNRFLSPTQKRQVTPKVTEMIPYSPQKIVIYGKPKVVLDQGVGCPLHEEDQCPEDESINNSKWARKGIHATKEYEQQQENNDHQQVQVLKNKYGSNADVYVNLNQKQKAQDNKVQKTKNQLKAKNSKRFKRQSQLQQTININTRMKSPKNYPKCQKLNSNLNKTHKQNQGKIVSSSRRSNKCCQNYNNIQSKIKFLIDRDKQNKIVEKRLDQQKSQIQYMQNRQNSLLLQQQEQKNYIKQNNKNSNSRQNINMNQYEQLYKQAKHRPKIVIPFDDSQCDSSSSSLSCLQIAKMHKHITKAERLRCYECQLQRLMRQKQRAKRSILSLNNRDSHYKHQHQHNHLQQNQNKDHNQYTNKCCQKEVQGERYYQKQCEFRYESYSESQSQCI